MKLFYQDSTIEINLDTTKINYLCIERHSVFRYMILELYEQYNGGEGPWIYNVNAKGVPIDKSLHVIMNPIQVDVNSKAILTKLNANLVKESNLMMEELHDVVSKLHQFFNTILAKQLGILCISSGSYGLDDIEKSLINGYTLDSDFCLI